MHNIAVGYKNAIKLLFGFGVACKIDSSVEKKTEENQCDTHDIKSDMLLFYPLLKNKTPSPKGPPYDCFHLQVWRCFLSLQYNATTWLDSHKAEIFYFYTKSEMGGNVVVQIKQVGLDPNIGTGIKYTL